MAFHAPPVGVYVPQTLACAATCVFTDENQRIVFLGSRETTMMMMMKLCAKCRLLADCMNEGQISCAFNAIYLVQSVFFRAEQRDPLKTVFFTVFRNSSIFLRNSD